MTPEQQANAWIAAVQERAMTRVRAESIADGILFSQAQLECMEIGVLAGAWEMLAWLTDRRDDRGRQI
ncbi:MAG: hypothetical protein ACJ71T_01340 [Actinomycetales bacterium]